MLLLHVHFLLEQILARYEVLEASIDRLLIILKWAMFLSELPRYCETHG